MTIIKSSLVAIKRGNSSFLTTGWTTGHGLTRAVPAKPITLQLPAESFSRLGVPVFSADVKGDLAGIAAPRQEHRKIPSGFNHIVLDGTPL